VLETEVTNLGALRLYEGLGFTRDKLLAKYYLNGVLSAMLASSLARAATVPLTATPASSLFFCQSHMRLRRAGNAAYRLRVSFS
jgi:hypothetical protein